MAADDERAIQAIEPREAVEDQRHLRRFVFDDRLGQQRRAIVCVAERAIEA